MLARKRRDYRPCNVSVGNYEPPPHYLVPELMSEFVNGLNRYWNDYDPIELGTYALWKLNHIHPFINGNGRTARALSYYLICVRLGALLPGGRILPQLIRDKKDEYVRLLQQTDQEFSTGFADLREFVIRLLEDQLRSQ